MSSSQYKNCHSLHCPWRCNDFWCLVNAAALWQIHVTVFPLRAASHESIYTCVVSYHATHRLWCLQMLKFDNCSAHGQSRALLSHLGDVVHDRDLELPVHEGLLWVWNLVIQHILEKEKDTHVLHSCTFILHTSWQLCLNWDLKMDSNWKFCYTYLERASLAILKHAKDTMI